MVEGEEGADDDGSATAKGFGYWSVLGRYRRGSRKVGLNSDATIPAMSFNVR